jgi:hypothetical protein
VADRINGNSAYFAAFLAVEPWFAYFPLNWRKNPGAGIFPQRVTVS